MGIGMIIGIRIRIGTEIRTIGTWVGFWIGNGDGMMIVKGIRMEIAQYRNGIMFEIWIGMVSGTAE